MIFSRRSLRFSVALAAAVGLLQQTTAEDGFQSNLRRGNIAFGETIPLDLQGVANEVSFCMCLLLRLSCPNFSLFLSSPTIDPFCFCLLPLSDQCRRRL